MKRDFLPGWCGLVRRVRTVIAGTAAVVMAITALSGSAPAAPIANIVYILDESSSVSAGEFNAEKNFLQDVTNSIVIGTDDSMAGIGAYATSGRNLLSVSASKPSILNTLVNAVKQGGNSCISCGLQTALGLLNSAPFPGAPRIVLFFTDGVSNVDTPADIAAALNDLDLLGTHLFPIISTPGNFNAAAAAALALGDGQVFQPTQFLAFNAAFSGLLERLATVPEPAALALFGLGLAGLGMMRRRRRG